MADIVASTVVGVTLNFMPVRSENGVGESDVASLALAVRLVGGSTSDTLGTVPGTVSRRPPRPDPC